MLIRTIRKFFDRLAKHHGPVVPLDKFVDAAARTQKLQAQLAELEAGKKVEPIWQNQERRRQPQNIGVSWHL
jgi:hypothetical protein